MVVEEEDDDEEFEPEANSKDLVRFLGMKDGVTASMASQGRLSDDLGSAAASAALATAAAKSADNNKQLTSGSGLEPPRPPSSRSSSIGATPLDRIIMKQASLDKKHNS